MSDPEIRALLERIAKLEHDVATLQKLVVQLYQSEPDEEILPSAPPAPEEAEPVEARTPAPPPPPRPVPAPVAPLPVAAPPARPAFELPAHMRSGEYWLGKVGIALVLFGVAFLFKYSIDQGWLTPSVRIAFGLALGVFLVVMGLRLHDRRRPFSQLLLGGGVATFYICGFAAYQVLDLVGYPVALGFMIAVTAVAFALSLKEDEVLLALIGALGGLGTPFLLYTEGGSLPGLVTYTCVVLAGATAIYFFKGWRSLLLASVAGGWIVFAIGRSSMTGVRADWLASDQWALQAAALFAWCAFWLVPVAREAASQRSPARWIWPSLEWVERRFSREAGELVESSVHALTISTPLLALLYSTSIWQLEDPAWGWITLAVALVYGGAGWLLRRARLATNFVYTHALVALFFLTLSFSYHFSGDVLFIAWATEALALHLVARRFGDRFTATLAHLLSALVAMVLGDRVLSGAAPEHPLLNARALADLWAVAVSVAVASFHSGQHERRVYFLAGQAALAALFIREFDGYTLLTILSLQGVFLHFLARATGDRAIRVAGHILCIGVAAWLADRLHLINPPRLFAAGGGFTLSADSLADLLAIACTVCISVLVTDARERRVYFLAGQAALAALFIREFDGAALISVLSLQGMALHLLALALGDRPVRAAGHVLFLGIAAWLAVRLFLLNTGTLFESQVAPFAVDGDMLANLFAIAALLSISWALSDRDERRVYRVAAHIGLLFWLWRELCVLPSGQAIVTISWGIYAVLLLVAGLRQGVPGLRLAGLGTLLAVVGKLFLVDLANLAAIWRVLLFLGFGGLFLLLSYYFRALWKSDAGGAKSGGAPPA